MDIISTVNLVRDTMVQHMKTLLVHRRTFVVMIRVKDKYLIVYVRHRPQLHLVPPIRAKKGNARVVLLFVKMAQITGEKQLKMIPKI